MSATPVWAQLAYLLAAVCFILALKGLSSPKTARTGNLIGAVGAVVACVGRVLLRRPRPRACRSWSRSRSARRSASSARSRVQMTQMPQLVALFNGVGGGAAALVALLELRRRRRRRAGVAAFTLAATAFTILVGSVSFAGSLVTFAKLQELMTSRPVVFPGLPVAFAARARSAALALAVVLGRRARRCGSASCSALVGLLLGVLLVLPVGGADVPIVISLLNAFTGLTVAAGGYVLGNTLLLVAGTLVGASGTFLTKLMAARDGPLGRQHPVRRAQGRLDPRRRRGLRPAGAVGRARGRRDPARLRRPRDHRARATGSRSRRPSTRCASWSTC